MMGGSLVRSGHTSSLAFWLEHSMRWVLGTALGVFTDPEVNRNLAMVSGVMAEKAAITADSSLCFSSSAKGVAPSVSLLRLPATMMASWLSAILFRAGR